MPPTSNRAVSKDSLRTRVLLVDNNEAFLRVASEFLQRQPELIVVGVCGGEEALVQAQNLGPQVILIGLDRSGLETISSRIRDVLPDVGIIALTLLEGNAYRQAALAAGTDGVLRKAELITNLLPAIRRVMQADRSR